MKISKLRKYITWNIISVFGYINAIITAIFLLFFFVASSAATVRADINNVFYDHISQKIILPYIDFYKFQLFLILVGVITSIYERKYYIETEQYGLRLFPNHERSYSILFVCGLALNFLPMYIFGIMLVRFVINLL